MKYRKIRVAKIQISPKYQRQLRQPMVGKIAKEFDVNAFGVIVVGERGDGSIWCVDGQTRLAAATRLDMQDVPCLVFESSGEGHEAKLFRLLNTQTGQTKLQKVKALICEGDHVAVDLNRLVEQCGFRIGFGAEKGWPFIRSMVPLQKAHELGILERVLGVIHGVWGAAEDEMALQLAVLGGLTKFIGQHGDVVDDGELVKRLQAFSVLQLMAQCESRKMQGVGRSDAMCDVLVKIWDQKRSKRDKARIL